MKILKKLYNFNSNNLTYIKLKIPFQIRKLSPSQKKQKEFSKLRPTLLTHPIVREKTMIKISADILLDKLLDVSQVMITLTKSWNIVIMMNNILKYHSISYRKLNSLQVIEL